MCNFILSEEEFNDLSDLRRHVGLVFGLAAAAQETDEDGRERRVELRASELSEIFSYIEGRLRDLVDAADERARAAREHRDGGLPVFTTFDLLALIETAAGERVPNHEPVLREKFARCVEIDPEMDRARKCWERAIAAR